MFLTAAALVLSLTAPAQTGFVTGPLANNQACFSSFTNTLVDSISVEAGVQLNPTAETPKAGDTFFVQVSIVSFSQPCAASLFVNPGFRLPAGWSFVAPVTNGPKIKCQAGSDFNHLSTFTCPSQPVTFADGTISVLPNGANSSWRVNDFTVMRIQVPVRATNPGDATVTAHVIYALSTSNTAIPVNATVPAHVFNRRPEVSAPTPAVTEISAHAARVHGFVDPHFNAGTIELFLAKAGQFEMPVVDTAQVDGSQDTLDIDSLVENLDADSDYRFRWAFQTQNGLTVSGDTLSFHTAPAPRFALHTTINGAGTLEDSNTGDDSLILENTLLSLTAHAAAGNHVASFVVNGFDVLATGSTSTSVSVASDVFVAVTFEADVVDNSGAGTGPEGNTGDNGAVDSGTDNGGTDNGGTDNGGTVDSGTVGGDNGGDNGGNNDDNNQVRSEIHFSDAGGDDAGADEGDGGCASTKAGSAPMLGALGLLAVLVRRRRR